VAAVLFKLLYTVSSLLLHCRGGLRPPPIALAIVQLRTGNGISHSENQRAHIANSQCGHAHFNNALESVQKKDWSISKKGVSRNITGVLETA
jgi:hypothetical protein